MSIRLGRSSRLLPLLPVVCVLASLSRPAPISAGSDPPFDPGRAGFVVRVKGEPVPYRVFAVFVLPGESLDVEALDGEDAQEFTLWAEAGDVVRKEPRKWVWKAPSTHGSFALRVSRVKSGDDILLNAFVMVPYSRVSKGVLNGYRIGEYPAKPFRGLPIYKPPAGFVEVTAENMARPVSPHFSLGQFLCKQKSGFPKYLVLRERLLLKLELLLEALNKKGHRADTFHIMSGYRTPHHNRAIGRVKHSRHLWGGGADIFVDQSPKDGDMDDLNGDGRSDWRDADVLHRLVDELFGKPVLSRLTGGLARYRRNPGHPPFVHIDARGWRARWK
ncbi:MAG: D-Ala-D-Ala carboxypeptidase family metallohydrolase [Elusimicrobiota bacterium]